MSMDFYRAWDFADGQGNDWLNFYEAWDVAEPSSEPASSSKAPAPVSVAPKEQTQSQPPVDKERGQEAEPLEIRLNDNANGSDTEQSDDGPHEKKQQAKKRYLQAWKQVKEEPSDEETTRTVSASKAKAIALECQLQDDIRKQLCMAIEQRLGIDTAPPIPKQKPWSSQPKLPPPPASKPKQKAKLPQPKKPIAIQASSSSSSQPSSGPLGATAKPAGIGQFSQEQMPPPTAAIPPMAPPPKQCYPVPPPPKANPKNSPPPARPEPKPAERIRGFAGPQHEGHLYVLWMIFENVFICIPSITS